MGLKFSWSSMIDFNLYLNTGSPRKVVIELFLNKNKKGRRPKSMPQLRYRQVPIKEHKQDLHPNWVHFLSASFFGFKNWRFSVGTIAAQNATKIFRNFYINLFFKKSSSSQKIKFIIFNQVIKTNIQNQS